MAFNPDKYLTKKKSEFNPDSYLASKGSNIQPSEDQSLEGISQLQSLLKGAEQGATFGGADELAGAVYGSPLGGLKTAGGGLLGLDVSQDPDVQKYVQARDESRAGFKAAEEANPKSYLGGELGAGIATSFIPGLGATSIPKLAALGAGAGALTSSSDLSKGEVGGVAKDAAISGTVGAALGTIPSVLNKVKGISFIGKPIEAFKRGFSKEQNLIGGDAIQGVENEVLGLSKQIPKDLQEGLQGNIDIKNNALNRLKQSGTKTDLEQPITEISNELNAVPEDSIEYKNSKQKLQDLLSNFTSKEGLSPNVDRADDLRKQLTYLAENESIPKEVKSLAQRLQGKISEKINLTDQELAQSNSDIQKYIKTKDLLGLDYKPGDLESQKTLGPLFNRLEKQGISGGVARAQFEEAMKVLKEANPELAQKIETSGLDVAEKYDLVNRINSEGVGLSKFLGFSLPGATTGAGNIAGLALGKAVPDTAKEAVAKGTMGALKVPFGRAIPSEIVSTQRDVNNSKGIPPRTLNTNTNYKDQIFNSKDDDLKSHAQRLMNSNQKIMMGLGNKLNDAIDNKDSVGKNAILNVIMQNPSLRRQFSGEDDVK